jgi:hypothetical protein
MTEPTIRLLREMETGILHMPWDSALAFDKTRFDDLGTLPPLDQLHKLCELPGQACTSHTGRHQVAERDCLMDRAKKSLQEYLDSKETPND